MKYLFILAVFLMEACIPNNKSDNNNTDSKNESNADSITYQESNHLKNIRQLTFGGDNAEAYFSRDDQALVFQSNNKAWGVDCDQIFYSKISDFSDSNYIPKMVSTGMGRTTCSYVMPDGKHIIYSSTHLGDKKCPKEVPHGEKYLWAVYPNFDIFIADLDGNIVKQLTDEPGYDAEPTISPDGKSIVFTSTRTGDLELYTMDLEGNNVKQITSGLGYDGGAFFSPDSKKLVFRASRPLSDSAQQEYKDYLSKDMVAPNNMEIYTSNVDGTELTQVTKLGKANWAPFFHPSGKKIIFSSNHASTGRGFDFHLFMIDIDGTNLKKITTESHFNAFPMFSYDGKKLVFSSNRDNGGTHETNLFIADWED